MPINMALARGSFREAVQAVVALRRPEFEGLTFEQKKQRLSENKEFSASRLEKLHAGIYPPFNNFSALFAGA